jgi:excisionase family DNA binding protein
MRVMVNSSTWHDARQQRRSREEITMEATELLNVSETAAALTIKESTVRAWILNRKLPYVKVGRLVRVRRSDVEAFINSELVTPETIQ